MTFQEFKLSISEDKAPAMSDYLTALWHDHKGEWSKAHDLIDPMFGKEAARIHAYLHRKEGDNWNADYWYRKADTIRPQSSLEEEWEELVNHYL